MHRIAMTPGEPAGIGPDLVIDLISADWKLADTEIVIIADRQCLEARAALLGRQLELPVYDAHTAKADWSLLHVAGGAEASPGCPDSATADYVLETIDRAAVGCMAQEFVAMVTGPVQKSVLDRADRPFSGHTEYLAKLSQSPQPVMLLVTAKLCVALLTTHLPLRAVADAIDADLIRRTIHILHRQMPHFFTDAAPKIGVCGLNPHAGDGGVLGDEEIRIIAPALAALADEGIQVSGPLPADSLFAPAQLACYDVILAMYHDQGLPVLKHSSFGEAVNVTLGLPFIRASVDHGTALDLVGLNQAQSTSLAAAITLAQKMADRRRGECRR